MDTSQNRRKSRRYSMDVPVRLGSKEGLTRDVSTRGLYFVAPDGMTPGAPIELDLALPSARPGPLSIRLKGRIVRMDDLGECKGMAAEIQQWEIPDGGMADVARFEGLEEQEG